MDRIKRFKEDIFRDESLLHEILQEYKDIGLKYHFMYNLQYKKGGDLYPGVPSMENLWNPKTGKIVNYKHSDDNTFRSYIIIFEKRLYDNLTSDVQRGEDRKKFGIPNDKTYEFMNITRDIQYRIESMGYTFALAINAGQFDIMIIDGKHE